MKKMKIIYEDKKLLVVSKEAGKLTVGNQKERVNTLYYEAKEYVKKKYPKNKIFIVHRLDKDTSGLIVFAKDLDTKYKLQNTWNNVFREYYAIVSGEMSKTKDVLRSYLYEDKFYNVYETNDRKKGKLAITEYEVIKKNKLYSLLRINIKTGRKNQIRVQLSNISHPIIGDKKYGSKCNPLNRLGLHAYKLMFNLDGKEYVFLDNIPMEMNKLMDN